MIIAIIEDLLAVMEEMRDYLLSPNQLLLDPRSIFCEKGRYYFCYYPANEQGIAESFHELTEFLSERPIIRIVPGFIFPMPSIK